MREEGGRSEGWREGGRKGGGKEGGREGGREGAKLKEIRKLYECNIRKC